MNIELGNKIMLRARPGHEGLVDEAAFHCLDHGTREGHGADFIVRRDPAQLARKLKSFTQFVLIYIDRKEKS